MTPRLDPKLDVVFKLLLTREHALLIDMLSGILARPIHDVDVVNPDIPGELASDKQIVLDIRTTLEDGSRADVEMQMRNLPALISRLIFYAARDYADQLRRGEGYHRLRPTTGIVWLVEPLNPPLDHRLHSIFELRERETHARLSDQLAIHMLQLSALPPPRAVRYTDRVQRWACFFAARSDAELDRLAAADPIMSLAKDTLDQLSQDPRARRLAREREDSIKLYQMHLAASHAEGEAHGKLIGRAEGEAHGKLIGRAEGEARGKLIGRAEGEAHGQATLVLKLLGLRFGELPPAARARVLSATPQQLEAWAERILTARRLDDVLHP